MTPEKWEQEIDEYKQMIEALAVKMRQANDYRDHTYGETYAERRKAAFGFRDSIKKLDSKITYRMNKLAALDGPPRHKDIFGQVFAIGQRVAWSSSSKYAGATLGWVVKITPKMISVSQRIAFEEGAYGVALMPRALIICDAIVASLEDDDE